MVSPAGIFSTTIIPHIMLCDDASLVVLCCFMLRILYFYAKTATQSKAINIIKPVILRNFNSEESLGFIRQRDSSLSLRMTFY